MIVISALGLDYLVGLVMVLVRGFVQYDCLCFRLILGFFGGVVAVSDWQL